MKNWKVLVRTAFAGLIAALALFGAGLSLSACGEGGAARVLLLQGGVSTAGTGGQGGTFTLIGVTGADMEIRRSGSVNTSFEIPDIRPELGDNPRTVTGNETIDPAVGDNVILGDDGLADATGLHVRPGATLTLGLNTDTGGTVTTLEALELAFSNGVFIEGHLIIPHQDATAQRDGASDNGADVNVTAQNIIFAPGAALDLSGDDDATVGGDGGTFAINASGVIVIHRDIDTRGGTGDDGGDGGIISIIAANGIYSTGDVSTQGGEGLDGMGGAGGNITGNVSTTGPLAVRGRWSSRGGDGTDGGNLGGTVNLIAASLSPLVFGVDLVASGGDGLDAASDAPGAPATAVVLVNAGGSSRIGGRITARGGAGEGDGAGASGASLIVSHSSGIVLATFPIKPALFFGADVDVSGGDGGLSAGTGGTVSMTSVAGLAYVGVDQGVHLVGYGAIDNSCGDGATGALAAGSMTIINPPLSIGSVQYSGDLSIESDLLARGCDGGTGNGGTGGFLTIQNAPGGIPVVENFDRKTLLTGLIDLSGGDGDVTGGSAQSPAVIQDVNVEIRGPIVARGGRGGTGEGGQGAALLTIEADDALELSSIDVSGGASDTDDGGDAGDMILRAPKTTVRGNLTAEGGESTSQTGGDGGTLLVLSTEHPTHGSGRASVAGGAGGGADGSEGTVTIDGAQRELTNGAVNF
ncbi:MAG: hypothetical protein AB1405_15980 [Bdellovibrionota bacterium]